MMTLRGTRSMIGLLGLVLASAAAGTALGGDAPADTTRGPGPRARPGKARLAPGDLPSDPAALSYQSCTRCHRRVHWGWKVSMHSVSWVDPEVQELWHHYGKPEGCQDCHLPIVSSRRGAAGAPDPAGFPAGLAGEGVNCAVCHVRDGAILAPHEGGTRNPESKPPHPVRYTEELNQSRFCADCHQSTESERPMYDTFREWEASPAAKQGIRCHDCHLPKRTRVDQAGGIVAFHTHGFLGSHTDLKVQEALELDVRTDRPRYARGETVVARVRLTNTGAGHKVPTGHPLHGIEVTAGIADQNGEFIAMETRWLRRGVDSLFATEEGEDTRLAPGETLAFELRGAIPGEGEANYFLTVQLTYHLLPPALVAQLGMPSEIVSRTYDSRVVPLL